MTFNYFFQNIVNKFIYFSRNIFSKPDEVTIEVTGRCNLDCFFCFNKFSTKNTEKNDTLRHNYIKDIITNISKFGIKKIRFSGGEPLIRQDIYDLMKYAKSKGLRVWLNTNATLINKQRAAKLSKLVDNVLVPLNSYDKETEFFVTGKNLFESKLAGLRMLKETEIKVVRIGTVLTKLNIRNLEKIHGLVKKLNIKYWELFRPIPAPYDLMPINNDDISILVPKIIKINEENRTAYKIFNAIPFCAFNPEQMAKIASGAIYDDGHTRLVISFNGAIKPMYYLNKEIGNILINKPFGSYWNHNFMKRMRYLKFAPEVCKRCRYLTICLGGSRAVSKLVNGNYSGLDYLAQPDRYKDYLFR
jgi:radical SAM protein with 4Fe4S-binding SPASM domain